MLLPVPQWLRPLVFASCAMTTAAMTLTGEIVPGVECPALKQSDGSVIALSFLPAPYKIGDQVTVSGSGFGGSMSCQQEVFLVKSVTFAN